MRDPATLLVTLLVLAGCGGDRSSGGSDGRAISVFCAAGMKNPVTRIAEDYRRECGVEVQLQFGGTGTLIAQIEIARQGDLFIAADAESVEIVRAKGLVRESIPMARQYPVVAVPRGNPKGIATLDDLFRKDVKVAIGNPEAASIGKATLEALGARWEPFRDHAAVMKPTVTEIALDLKVGSVDAAVVWNSTMPQFDDLDSVRLPEFDSLVEEVSVSVLSASEGPTEALRFARYLVAPTKGGKTLRELGIEVVDGVEWDEEPERDHGGGEIEEPAS